jgi:Protein of unknown function (DUF2934)
MPNDKNKNTPVTPISDSRPNLEESIRHRAYELYETRGCEDGHDVDDWLRAEAEVTHATARTFLAA